MRLIDDKGRIFGKINIIDLIAVILLLSFGLTIYVSMGIVKSKRIKYLAEFMLIDITRNNIRIVDENGDEYRMYRAYPEEFSKYYKLLKLNDNP